MFRSCDTAILLWKIDKKFFEWNVFRHPVLPEYLTGKMEPVIRDTSKYNLVIFSASGCGYCHLQIPLLKEIYKDWKDVLEMTYISLDRPTAIFGRKKVMREKEIPWRSLVAAHNLQEINYHFSIRSIPYALLYYPGGKKEVIAIRKTEQKEKLYSLLKNISK